MAKSETIPTFTLTADDPAFEKVVMTHNAAVQTRYELDKEERDRRHEEAEALVRAARAYQEKHGVVKPRIDMARRWEKV